MTSLPFQFLNSVLLWTRRNIPYREIFPGFAHVPNTISHVTWLEILGQQQNFYTPYVSTPFSPFLFLFLTGPSFILSSFLALKAYLLSKVAGATCNQSTLGQAFEKCLNQNAWVAAYFAGLDIGADDAGGDWLIATDR